jgi:hypothetical protein
LNVIAVILSLQHLGQLRDPRQMMIVVLCDKEGQVNHADSYIQTRMQRHGLHQRFVVTFETPDELHTLFAKRSQDIFERVCVVIRRERLLIGHVGGGEGVAARFEIIEATDPQFLEVEQMPRLFLNRSFVAHAARQYFSRQTTRQIFESSGSSSDSLVYVCIHPHRQFERELPLIHSSRSTIFFDPATTPGRASVSGGQRPFRTPADRPSRARQPQVEK